MPVVDRLEGRVLFAAAVGSSVVPRTPKAGTTSSAVTLAAVTAVPAVRSLTLINADTDQPIAGFNPLANNATLNLATLPTKNLNVRANTSPAAVGSVRFSLDTKSNFRTENAAPYTLAGDGPSAGVDYYGWTPTLGSHKLTATPYTGANGGGSAGTPLTINFTVTNSGATLPTVSATTGDASASETGPDAGRITITRTGATTAALSVNVAAGGTATSGADYTGFFSPVTIPAGSASATVTINPINDAAVEGSETVLVTILSGSGYRVGSTAGSATITIADNDAAPPPTTIQAPWTSPFTLPTTIEAEQFDKGGERVAYHDLDPANVSGGFRPGEGVDVEPTTDAGGGYNLGHVQAGEWVEYTVNVPVTGNYDIGIRFASGNPGGTVHVEVGGVDVTGPLALNSTGGWQTWQTVWKTGVTLTAGQNVVLRLSVDASNGVGQDVGNINSIVIRNAASSPAAPITWAKKAPSPWWIEESMGATVGGRLYLFGGLYGGSFLATDRIDVYTPATDTWAARRPMPEKLTHAATVVDGTTVWLIGGYVGDHPGPGTTSVWKYDTVTDSWARGPRLPVASGAGGAGIVGRTIYYFGGKNETRTEETNVHLALNLDNQAAGWSARASMPGAGRDHFSAAALGGYLYAIGGRVGPDEMGTNQVQVDRYDPSTDTWTRAADLPGTISNTVSATFIKDGRIYILGGESIHNVAADVVWSYDPAADRWLVHTALPQARRAGVAGVIDGKIIYTTGWYLGVQRAETWVGS